MLKERCEKLMAALSEHGVDGAIITSRTNIRYFSNFTSDESVLIITDKRRVLLTDFRYTIQANQLSAPDFEVIEVSRAIAASEIASVLTEMGVKKCAFEDGYLTVRAFNSYRELPVELVPMTPVIDGIRLVKDEYEIEMLKKAQSIADAAFAELITVIHEGMTEKEVANELDHLLRLHGADENSFDTIVGSGPNGALCHATPGPRRLQKGDLVVIDFGARYNGYCSDMTRTIAIGEPSDELRKIYNIVLRAQLSALDKLRPNMSAKELDTIARDVIAAEGYGECFGHSLGHGFGLDIHESPYASQRSDDTLVPGSTITVEPGIYVEDLGGVRIEDDCVLTEDGYIDLASTTKKLIVI
ncbi:MAG: aminopeptidase P family protein [Clostridiales bacterium]|nr:aminopeptidase P family protein [Clostridiales bacterium]